MDYEGIAFSGINLGTRATDTHTCTSSHIQMSYFFLFFLFGAYRMFYAKGLVDALKKREKEREC